MMSLSHSDIYWCSRSQEDITIIDHCGEFPNVPLLGIRGGITYNPSLDYDNLVMLEESVPMTHSFKVLYSTMRTMSKAIIKGLFELGEW